MDFKPLSVIATELGVSVDDIYCATCSYNNDATCKNTGTPIMEEWNNFCGRWNSDKDKLEK